MWLYGLLCSLYIRPLFSLLSPAKQPPSPIRHFALFLHVRRWNYKMIILLMLLSKLRINELYCLHITVQCTVRLSNCLENLRKLIKGAQAVLKIWYENFEKMSMKTWMFYCIGNIAYLEPDLWFRSNDAHTTSHLTTRHLTARHLQLLTLQVDTLQLATITSRHLYMSPPLHFATITFRQ
jgi:hypothetical protein